MSLLEHHSKPDLVRYLDGTMEAEEKNALERHLASCAECRDFLSFVKGFNQRLGGLSHEEFTSDEPCPDSWTLVSYEAGQVDEETARHMRTHLLFCDDCAKEFYVLRCVSREESWRELIERLKAFVIDLAKSYGPGASVGAVRIVAEQPAFAVRGRELPKVISKVLEVHVSKNRYSIEVRAEEGGITFDIAGFEAPLKKPLRIQIRSGRGEEIVSSETDELGNARFLIPVSVPTDEMYVVNLTLDGSEQDLLLRVPQTEASP